MANYPTEIESPEHASVFVGLKPGERVYLVGDCGDHYEGRSVVIPHNQKGTVREFFLDPYNGNAWWKMRVDLVASPGRPFLEYSLEDAKKLLSRRRTKRLWPKPKPSTRHEHVMADTMRFGRTVQTVALPRAKRLLKEPSGLERALLRLGASVTLVKS